MIKILLILHLPPPIHGASVVSSLVKQEIENVSQYESRSIRINSSSKISDVANFSLKKIGLSCNLIWEILVQLISFRPNIIYFTASCNGFAFYRDFLINLLFIFFSGEKTKIYYHLHNRGIVPFTDNANTLKLRLIRFFFKNRNLILLSPSLKQDYSKLNLDKIKYHYLSNAVADHAKDDTINFSHQKYEGIDKYNILFLSNMIKTKGYDIVLDIVKNIKIKGYLSKFHFHFAGAWKEANDESEFNTFLKIHDLKDNVTFHGFCDNEKKNNLLKKCHCLFFPTRYFNEAFPLVIIEALSFGLPILASNIGAIPDIVTKEVGLCEDILDINYELFINFCSNYLNEKTSQCCRDSYIKNYTIDMFSNNLLKILSNE